MVECNLAKVKAKGSSPFSCLIIGWMAEWFKATVLKTVVFKHTVGSNPTLSYFLKIIIG